MIRHFSEWIMRRSLRDAFRRVVLVGDATFPADRPVVLYANHHYFHDGFLLWLVLEAHSRRAVTWMQEWDRVPLFAPAGAMPFPADDPARRAATVRETARRMASGRPMGLIWFPEGVLHPAADGILSFDPETPARLHRVLGNPAWMAAAVVVEWGTTARPTALLAVGEARNAPDGSEHRRLEALLSGLLHRDPRAVDAPPALRVLLDGRSGPEEWLPLHRTRRFFSRYL